MTSENHFQKQVKIFLWNECNNRCLMCTNPLDLRNNKKGKDYSLEAKKKEISSRTIDGDRIQFTGGETTMYPDFLELMFWTRENFPSSELAVLSNGRMFSYEDFTKKLLDIDNLDLRVPFLGYNDKTHDDITNVSGSFKETKEGVSNILKYRNKTHRLEIRIVLSRKNFIFLDKMMDFVYDEFKEIDSLVVLFPLVMGSCRANFKNIGLEYRRIMPKLENILDDRLHYFKDLRLYHFPLCIISRHLWSHTCRSLVDDIIHFSEKCSRCLHKKHCLGIPRHYFEIMGDDEFRPILKDMKVEESDHNFSFHPIIK